METAYLTKQEAADYLRISLSKLNVWLREKVLPHYKIGSRVLLSRDDLDKFVALNKK